GNGNGNGHGNGAPQPQAQQPQAQPMPRPFQAPPRPNPYDNGRGNHDLGALRDTKPSDQMMMPPLPPPPRNDVPGRKDGGAALDQELRSRVDGDITAFLAAFDAVLAADSQESRFGLKEA